MLHPWQLYRAHQSGQIMQGSLVKRHMSRPFSFCDLLRQTLHLCPECTIWLCRTLCSELQPSTGA